MFCRSLSTFIPSSVHKIVIQIVPVISTKRKIKFPIKDFFSKCDQIRSFRRIWSYLLAKSLKEKEFFAVHVVGKNTDQKIQKHC